MANKVHTLAGADLEQRWLSIDARMLYRAAVGASEVYNTVLEQRLSTDLAMVFTDRDRPDRSRRPALRKWPVSQPSCWTGGRPGGLASRPATVS